LQTQKTQKIRREKRIGEEKKQSRGKGKERYAVSAKLSCALLLFLF
jgi:hypothetical protein